MRSNYSVPVLGLALALLAAPALAQDGPAPGEEKPAGQVKLSVTSNPSKALVYVRYIKSQANEKLLGTTPATIELDPGVAEVVVVKDGYICRVEPLNLVPGGAARLEVRLTRDVEIPHALNLKSSPRLVRSSLEAQRLYDSVLAHVVHFYVEEKDPRELVESSVETMIRVLNAVRGRELLLRRELSADARRRYYGEEFDLRSYPKLIWQRKERADGVKTYSLQAGAVAVEGLTDGSLESFQRMLWESYAFVKKRWDGRGLLSDSTLARLLIEGQIAKLDDGHTHFLTPDDMREMGTENEGAFGGVGIVVSLREGKLTVIAPMEGTPAQRKGIMAGDWIVAIDGVKTKGLRMQECVDKMRGKIDSPVELTIHRNGRELAITLLRARIKIRHTTQRVLGKIGYLRISSFMNEHLDAEVGRAIAKLEQKGAKALVIDLRNNPGGLLPQAHKLCDMFVKAGEKIVSTRTRKVSDRRQLNATDRSKLKLPVAVLINGGSASASEILAGVLQEHKLATVVGEKSFGKGSVQRVLPLTPFDCAMALTVATYHLPSGATPHKRGITPDKIVPMSEEQQLKLMSRTNYAWDADTVDADPQLKAAIKLLMEKIK